MMNIGSELTHPKAYLHIAVKMLPTNDPVAINGNAVLSSHTA